VVNTIFGFGLYALLVKFGVNLYLAQIISHLLGMCFNYFTYSRHVFREKGPAKLRFAGAYGVNYLMSLGALAVADIFIESPYVAGFIATVSASLINYFALKYAVFVRHIE
jgi:putative flippase GtrA